MFNIGKIKFSSNKTVLIAEAGVNHNGNIEFAKKLIDKAKEANCDIIKFQTYKAERLTTINAPRFWNWSGEKKKKDLNLIVTRLWIVLIKNITKY